MKTRGEIKAELRDWMVSTTTLVKVSSPGCHNSDIAFWWRKRFDIRMNEKWIAKHLGGPQNRSAA